MRMFLKVALAAAAVTALPSAASAGAVIGFTGSTMPNSDDTSVGPIALGTGFSVNYFNNTYSATYISTNGYITFGTGQSSYTPSGLGAGYSGLPIIAAFYADVDTRNGGTTTYGTGTFDGRQAFGVTYNNVAVFGGSTNDKRNTFELILVNRSDTGANNFDIVLNYDKVQWETGSASGGSNGLGGTSAAVGYNAGTGNQAGTFFQLPGSLVNGALIDGGGNSLVANSNVGIAGRYVFNVRNGNVTPPPQSGVPEPTTWAMMMLGFGALGATLRRTRRQNARIRFA